MKATVKLLADMREKLDGLAIALSHELILDGKKQQSGRDRVSHQAIIRDVDKQTSVKNLTGLVRQIGGLSPEAIKE
jgi:hypothetical protein